mmetsp:Transcript_5893/g.36519  ORF Transcript_5893/g.36519 Transcript_5893/m.36519 type:complete len:293 (-) Transcript_5893:618-1496(-)
MKIRFRMRATTKVSTQPSTRLMVAYAPVSLKRPAQRPNIKQTYNSWRTSECNEMLRYTIKLLGEKMTVDWKKSSSTSSSGKTHQYPPMTAAIISKTASRSAALTSTSKGVRYMTIAMAPMVIDTVRTVHLRTSSMLILTVLESLSISSSSPSTPSSFLANTVYEGLCSACEAFDPLLSSYVFVVPLGVLGEAVPVRFPSAVLDVACTSPSLLAVALAFASSSSFLFLHSLSASRNGSTCPKKSSFVKLCRFEGRERLRFKLSYVGCLPPSIASPPAMVEDVVRHILPSQIRT